jgi:quercetin dioxygenase-like cupin family protein/alkylhydroperoxidase/carboxymuconolactone decarboxylase family protein YurZ
MQKLLVTMLLSAFIASVQGAESENPIHREGSQVLYGTKGQQSFKGAADWFTGEVNVRILFPPNDTAQYSGAYVTFKPGARTAWHLHPAGQHMIVTDGVCLTGTRDGTIIRCGVGETVWCPPNIDHWHGATPDQAMTHLVITGSKNGQNVSWKEHVTDEQYYGKVRKATEEKTMNINEQLSNRQQAIIPIAAFTASGDLERLQSALIEGLDAGLTINEIKEIPVHLYAYAGFPRSLNALAVFMKVLDERKARGIEDPEGKEPSPVPPDLDKDEYGAKVRAKLSGVKTDISGAAWQRFSPITDTFLKEHLFADLFARDVISHQDRELATISALANMTGTEGQLSYHLGAAMNTGLTKGQMTAFVQLLKTKVGKAQAESPEKLLSKVSAKN